MKKSLFIALFCIINFLASAQTAAYYEVKLDSVVVTSFSTKGKGKLTIVQHKSWTDHKVHVFIVRGMRPTGTEFNYNTIALFNTSTVTEELRKVLQPGDRIEIELISRKAGGTNFALSLKVVE
jgi:hypothetical protein